VNYVDLSADLIITSTVNPFLHYWNIFTGTWLPPPTSIQSTCPHVSLKGSLSGRFHWSLRYAERLCLTMLF